MTEASTHVNKALEGLVREGPEIGLQVAAYLNGELVVDSWAGLADRDSGRPVDGDTLFMVSSATKGVTATCMHILAEHGDVDYDAPIVRYWPEFGQHGKEKALVRHALAQRTGVPQTPVGYTPEWLADWDKMCRGIAALEPMFEPGLRTAYHSLNFGHICGEILRRADGRDINRFLQDEVCQKLGLDIYMGVPTELLPRVARLVDGPLAPAEYSVRLVGEPTLTEMSAVFNRPEIQQSAIPGSGGIMNAHSLARMYASLIGEVDGVRLLPEERMRAATELQSYELDEIYLRRIRRALGYRLGSDAGPLASPQAFGHTGGGGNFGYADPARGLTIAFAKNYYNYGGRPSAGSGVGALASDSPAQVAARAVFEALGL